MRTQRLNAGSTPCIIYDILIICGILYTLIRKRLWFEISTIFTKTKDFSRSQPVTYTVNVVIFRKGCQSSCYYRSVIGSDIWPVA